jgi:hypothetical protein
MHLRPALLASLLGLAAGCGEQPEEPRNMTAEEVARELADMRIAPGLWELTSEVADVRGPDLPVDVRRRMIGPRTRLTHCITPEQAEEPSANFLALRSDNACTYREFTLRDGVMRGEMICPGATATMEGRYGAEAYDLRMQMESPLPDDATMTLEIRARGRRVGECEQGRTK